MPVKDKKQRDFSDVPIRVKSWGIIVLVLIAALTTPLLTYLSVALLSWGCYREYANMAGLKNRALTALFLGLIFVQLACSYTNHYFYFAAITLGAAILSTLIFRKMVIFKMVLVSIFSMGSLAFIRNTAIETDFFTGIKILLFVLILTELNDVFQYLCGKLFGRHRIAPRISPNKTTEGFIGGLMLTTILSNLLGPFLWSGNNHFTLTTLGILIGSAGFFGDLLISAEKRKFQVKDTGTLIPGHGGLLDRVDSLIFVAPIYYWIIQ